MAGILKEPASVKDFWLEPDSREVVPERLATTDMAGRVLEEAHYSKSAGLELTNSLTGGRGVLVDFGKEVGGYPHLVLDKSGCRIGVQAVESREHLMNPLLARTGAPADRSINLCRLKVKDGKEIDLPHWGGFRYLWLYLEDRGRASLKKAWVEYTPYLTTDTDSCGYFISSDEELNRLWYTGLHTLEMCTVDPSLGGCDGKHTLGDGEWVLIDGAKRDRLVWTADLDPMGAAVYVSNNNTGAIRDSLASLAVHQRKNGYIPACSPVHARSPGPPPAWVAGKFFADYVAWWVVCLYQYYVHTGSLETLRELFPMAKRGLRYLHSQCRKGLFRQTPLNMMEWCYTVLRWGKPTYTNVMYYWALNAGSYLAYQLGEDEPSTGYISRAFRLGETINRGLWDEKRDMFIDSSIDRRRVPQDANSLAIASGLVSEPDEARGILEYLKENLWEEWGSTNVDVPYHRIGRRFLPHNKRVMPFMNYYEALARFMADDDRGAIDLIRRCWGNMLQGEPGSTFWEFVGFRGGVDNHFTSLCHGCSAGVMSLLTRYVLGIRPTRMGYRRFRFDPRPVGLDWVEGRIPVPGGFIQARVERKKDGGLDKKVESPKGIILEGE